MAEELYFDETTCRYFKSTAERIKEIQDSINMNLDEKLKNCEKEGEIVIPRGLSDEEVLRVYHDKETNEEITKRIIHEAKCDAVYEFYVQLGLTPPLWLDIDRIMD